MKHHFIPSMVILLSLSSVGQVDSIVGPKIPQTDNTRITPGNSTLIPQNNTKDDRYKKDYRQQRMEDSSSLSGGSMGGATSGARPTHAPVGIGSGVDSGTGAGMGSGF